MLAGAGAHWLPAPTTLLRPRYEFNAAAAGTFGTVTMPQIVSEPTKAAVYSTVGQTGGTQGNALIDRALPSLM